MVPCNVTVEPYNEEDSNGETGKFHRQRGLRMKRKSYETGGSGTADSKILLPESPPGKKLLCIIEFQSGICIL